MTAPDAGAAAAEKPASPPSAAPAAYAHRRTHAEVRRCKRLERTDLKTSEWGKFGYASRSDILERPIEYDAQTLPILRVPKEKATPQWFYEHVASRNLPAIIEGGCAHWEAMHRWNFETLEDRFRHLYFKVGEDDKGKKIKMKMKYFLDYMRHQTDDNPLYLFETEIQDNAHVRTLLQDYEVPDLFPDDWLNLMNRDARPPHRWWCIGPKRSGTTVHVDPLGTSAWNAVTHGTKRWVLFEPATPKKVAKAKSLKEKSEDDEAVMYFDFLLPRIKKTYPEVRVYEGLQKAGDIIFVPGGWWHGVLNTEDCVAVTQNYCGPDNFETVWKSVRRDREKIAHLWLRNMRKFAPPLHRRALDLNRVDGFRMRHERSKGERLPDASSSSSESSDSSSDEAVDFNADGLRGLMPSEQPSHMVLAPGVDAFKGQPPHTKEGLRSHKHRRNRSRSRSRSPRARGA